MDFRATRSAHFTRIHDGDVCGSPPPAAAWTAFRDGRFSRFTEKDGLLSDNIAKIEDDGESLWLATTRGICRIDKQQLKDFAQGRRKTLEPLIYGVEDGLRSAQCSPAYPVAAGGNRMADGRLWFTTSRGLAVFDPKARWHRATTRSRTWRK